MNTDAPALVPSPRPCNVVLIGLMGSGKTTVGKLVAHSLGFRFVDTDHLIINATGKTIPQIFAAEGEESFRQHETAALRSLRSQQHLVIATGGGIVTRPENLPILHQLGYVVWLNATPNTLYQRTAHNDERPLLLNADPEGTLHQLLSARADLYASAADLTIHTDDLDAKDVAYGLAESVRVAFARPPG